MATITWFMDKNEETGDVYVFVNGKHIRSRKTQEIQDAVQKVDLGSTEDEIKILFKGSPETQTFSLLKWNHEAESDFARLLGTLTHNEQFISNLVDYSTVQGPKTNIKQSSPTQASKKRKIDAPQNSDICILESEDTLLKKAIKVKLIGRYPVYIDQLLRPKDEAEVRPIDRKHVDELKKQLANQPFGKLSTVLPCLIQPEMCRNKVEFEESKLNNYKLYTLGGNHVITACSELIKEKKLSDCHRTVDVDIYADLSAKEARFIGNYHNMVVRSKPSTFTDRVRLARKLLYEELDLPVEEELPAKAPECFLKRLHMELGCDENITVGSLTTVKHVAMYSSTCWKLFNTIVENFEQGSRCLNQTQFQNFQGLAESERVQLLKKVQKGLLTLKQAGIEARLIKQLEVVREAFVLGTDCGTWECAVDLYEEYTTDERLKQFATKFSSSKKGTKNQISLPTDFLKYCHAARVRENSDAYKVEGTRVVHQGKDVTSDPDISNLVDEYQQKLREAIEELKQTVH